MFLYSIGLAVKSAFYYCHICTYFYLRIPYNKRNFAAMKTLHTIYLTLLLLLPATAKTQCQTTYTYADSVNVVKILKEGMQTKNANLMLFYGHKFLDVPYVAHTLEVNKKEKLIVNLRQMDCTTFVETVFALYLTTKDGSTKWVDYCRNLEKIRYRNGKNEGYASRNHYFLWWTDNNAAKGLVSLPLEKATDGYYRKQTINLNYMSMHATAYSMLKNDAKSQKLIAEYEKASQGRIMRYIPRDYLLRAKTEMKYVENGDILAICTKKRGLDTTHIGIAEWGTDGRLHLLNASQIHKKVVLESMTLYEYMTKHPSQLGIWVIRPK